MDFDEQLERERIEAIDSNTPPARLARLMEKHANRVLVNPALPLLLVAEPGFWARLSDDAQGQVGRSKRCPQSFVEWALQQRPHSPARIGLIENASLPRSVRRQVYLGDEPDLERLEENTGHLRMLLREILPADELALLERAGLWTDPTVAMDRALDGSALARVATLGRVGKLLAVSHPNCPAALLSELWDVTDVVLARLVVQHPQVPLEVMQAAVASSDPLTRHWLASTARLPESLQLALALDPDDEVRGGLAWNAHFTDAARRALRG